MPNLTLNQKLSLVALLLSLLASGGTTLTEIFGSGLAAKIAAGASFFASFVNGATLILTSQNNVVKEVAAMPGVEKVQVNAQANQVLAASALDPNVNKVSATSEAIPTVIETAKGNGHA